MKKALLATFWLLVVNFLALVHLIFNPGHRNLTLISLSFFFSLGTALLVLTLRQKIKGALKKFLILTAASAMGFVISAVLHNLIFALFMHWPDDEVFFFALALFVFPILFLAGAIGSIVLFIKSKNGKQKTNP